MTSTDPAEVQARDRVGPEVAAVLLAVGHALDRARRAQQLVASDGVDHNAELALAAAILDLDRLRIQLLEVAGESQ